MVPADVSVGPRRAPVRPVPARVWFWYPEDVKSSVSIVLFFLLSGFFLAVLLGAIERSRRLLAIAGGCLVAVVCIIVFLTPVELPSWHLGWGDDDNTKVEPEMSVTTSSAGTIVTAGTTVTSGKTVRTVLTTIPVTRAVGSPTGASVTPSTTYPAGASTTYPARSSTTPSTTVFHEITTTRGSGG